MVAVRSCRWSRRFGWQQLASKRRALEELLERVARLEAANSASTIAPNPVLPRKQPPRVDPPAPLAAGPRLIAVPDLSATPAPAQDVADDRYADLLGLAEAGASAEEIARETGRPIGHVELILNLGRKPGGPPAAGPRAPRGRP
ncbi:MAG: hypothetical protein U0800_20430 [Isosphaeraceae bacterium]